MWADDWILDKLKGCFAYYEKDDIAKALIQTYELFRGLAVWVADRNGYKYPQKAENTSREYMEKMK